MNFEKRFEDPFVYAEYEYKLAKDYIIPKFKEYGIDFKGKTVLDAGCGWGGCSLAFSEAKSKCMGIDVSKHQILIAKKFSKKKKAKIEFHEDDICNLKTKGKFDVIILRDVIEYVNSPLKALVSLKDMLANEGIFYITLAPWYGPYGGHQHHPDSITRYMPYSHLLPKGIFFRIVKGKKGLMSKDIGFLEEIKRIRNNKLSILNFEKLLEKVVLKILKKNLYLLRPAFKIRMGLPTINSGIFGKIPVLNEFIITGAEYFLKK